MVLMILVVITFGSHSALEYTVSEGVTDLSNMSPYQ